MQLYLCGKNEKIFATIAFILFISLTILITILGFSPLHKAMLESCLYIITITGIFTGLQSIKLIGIGNFAGKSMLFLSLASATALFNLISINFGSYTQISPQTLFILNEYLWLTQTILLSIGLLFLLTTYKLTFPKNLFLKSILFFICILFLISIFSGWPQILNTILITTGIISLVLSGKKTHSGIIYLSSGLILLAISNIIFFQKTWSEIYILSEISDITLLISWVMIVIGIYCTKNHHA